MRKTGSVEETHIFKRTPRAHVSQISSPSDTPYPSLTLVIKMSALSKHSPARRNKPNTSGWLTPFSAQPDLVDESGWECPHNACGGGLALKLRRNGKEKFVVYTKQVYKNPTTCQFACSFFRPSKENPHIWTKTPISSRFFWIGFAFWGLEPDNNSVGQDNPQFPRVNEHIA